ncbi:MAG: hypothetical protein PUC29_06340 [Clostridia bacterium]|nr:hypothetical protein [Clostridia bacterium]
MSLIVLLIVYIILSSFCVFGVTFLRNKYEVFLPFSVTCIILLLFVFGVFGSIKLGFYLVLFVSILFYVLSLSKIVQHKEERLTFCRNIFTPAFFIFLLSFCALALLNYGRLAHIWDEFSHWADIVKVMVNLDDFGASPLSNSGFKSYPPAMSLFQYFYQKIGLIVNPDSSFTDWWLYHAYQVFFLSFLMPFFTKRNKRKTLLIIPFGAIVLSPMFLFPDFYVSIYIDAILGVISGCGLFVLCTFSDNDRFSCIYLCCICSMLVLSKDAGLFFALFLLIIYFIIAITSQRISKLKGYSFFLILSVAIPKLLWKYELYKTDAPIRFSNRIDFSSLVKIVTGNDSTYKSEVYRKFWTEFYARRCVPTVFGEKFYVSYLILLALFVAVFAILFLCVRRSVEKRFTKCFAITLVFSVLQTIIYIFGVCVSYIFKFTENEALRLASFERYINIAFLSITIMTLLILNYLYTSVEKPVYRMVFLVALCVSVCVTTPWKDVYQFATREGVRISIDKRNRYDTICSSINKYAQPGDVVYFVAQGDDNNMYHYLSTRYTVRPIIVTYVDNGSFSFGKSSDELHEFTKDISASEWLDMLMNNYDYVALYRIDEYFIETYGDLFLNKSEIRNNSVYRVDKTDRVLVRCE